MTAVRVFDIHLWFAISEAWIVLNLKILSATCVLLVLW